MKAWPPRWARTLAGFLLGPGIESEDRPGVLDDLTALAERVRARRGRVVGVLWYLWQASRYPLHQLWSVVRGTGTGTGAGADAVDGARTTSDRRPTGRVERWVREFRFAARRLRRHPTATAVIVGTLGVGVGAGTSVFAVLNVLVLGPLPFEDPDGLVRVRESMAIDGQSGPREVSMSPRRFELLRDRSDAFEDVAAVRYRTFTLAGAGDVTRVVGLRATANYFSVLGVPPQLGRAFGPDEDRPGAPAPVVVIAHSLWQRNFGADPEAVGSRIEVNGRMHTVVGVMPPGFRYPYAGEVWLPMGIEPGTDDYEDRGLNVTARLAPTTTLDGLPAALDALSERLAAERPDVDANSHFVFRTIEEEVLEDIPAKVTALLWAACFVLLIGAANVASMMMARLHGEARELDVQVALGAGRADLARRMIAEVVLLAAVGLGAGLLLSSQSVGFLTALSPVSDLGPYFQDFRVDARVVGFGAFLAATSVLVAALPTLVRLGRGGFGRSLRSRTTSTRVGGLGGSFLDLLVIGEVAIAVVLLTGTGLTVQTLRGEWGGDLGIETDGLYTFGVSPTPAGYTDPGGRIAWISQVLERVRALPGVDAVGLTNLNPLRSQGWGAAVWPEGAEVQGSVDYVTVNHRGVTPGYFEAAGTDVVQGRAFGAEDGPDGRPVAVVSELLATRLWPGESAVGKSLRVGRASSDGEVVSVVGVVEDVDEYDFLQETWYRPYSQDPRDYNTEVLELFVRGSGDSADLVAGIRAAISGVDASVPVFSVEAVDDLLRFERRVETFAVLLLSLFALIGIALAGVGMYGILSYSTGRRTAELGLRIALGAARGDVVRDVTRRTLHSLLIGLGLGCIGAVGLARLLQAIVAGVPAFRVDVFVVAAALTLLIGALAALGPALRALRIHPRQALTGN